MVFYLGGILRKRALAFSLNCIVLLKMRLYIARLPYETKLTTSGNAISNCAGSA